MAVLLYDEFYCLRDCGCKKSFFDLEQCLSCDEFISEEDLLIFEKN